MGGISLIVVIFFDSHGHIDGQQMQSWLIGAMVGLYYNHKTALNAIFS